MGMRVTRRDVMVAMAGVVGVRAAESKLRVVVVGGHPGDPEYGCGGTIARYAAAGHAVTILYLNHGERGCGSVSEAACGARRTAEAERASKILGARAAFAGLRDGGSVVDGATYSQFDGQVEELAPDVVLTHWPMDRHPDHRAAAMLAQDAWGKMKERFALYYYEVAEDTVGFRPVEYVDITAVEKLRREACYAHASQRPDHYYPAQDVISRFRGMESGCAEAEAFAPHLEGTGRRLLP